MVSLTLRGRVFLFVLIVAGLVYFLVDYSAFSMRDRLHANELSHSLTEDRIYRPGIDMDRVDKKLIPKDGRGEQFKPINEQSHDIPDIPAKITIGKREITNETLFRTRPFVIWSTDFHIGPIRDLKHFLRPLGVEFIDKSLSGACARTGTCARGLKVLHPGNGINLDDPKLIPSFYEAYKNDPEMELVDAFVCFHPAAMCELYMPFNKSIIVIASTRYEMGRHDANRWKNWNENLIKISKDPKNLVAANNEYDAKYIEYFTGINVKVLPSFCGYIPESYNPSRPEFLLAEVHQGQFQAMFFDMFKQEKYTKSSKVELVPLRQMYPEYKFKDLTSHKGIVFVPYQVSIMSLFEQYRMNIPLFFPSLDLLSDWQFHFHVMTERTWSQVGGIIPGGSPLQGVKEGIPDPNNDRNKVALRYWIKYADFYVLPHIIHYTSVGDLVFKMETTNLTETSEKMKKYNAEFKDVLLNKWKTILINMYNRSSHHTV